MKRLIKIGVILSLILVFRPAFTAEGGKKGVSAQAYEHASDQAIFNRISDWFATIGKSKEDKIKILEEQKAKRAERRREKEIEKVKREAEKAKEKTQRIQAQTKERVKKELREQQKTQEQTRKIEKLQEQQGKGVKGIGKGVGKGRK